MACACAVVVSAAAALPEVAGDAAVIVSPHVPDQLVAALHRVLTDDPFRRDLVARGRARARQFTWERAARETEAVYAHVEEEARRAAGARRPHQAGAARFTRGAHIGLPGSIAAWRAAARAWQAAGAWRAP
jgi:hypothetical protein